jgi:hypothetical protein
LPIAQAHGTRAGRAEQGRCAPGPGGCRRLARQLAKADGALDLHVTDPDPDPDGASETVAIPSAACRLLEAIASVVR